MKCGLICLDWTLLFIEIFRFLRSSHGLPKVPFWFPVGNPGGNPTLSEYTSHAKPSTDDALAGRSGMSGLRLGGVFNSAVLAVGRVVTPKQADEHNSDFPFKRGSSCDVEL
jgi:hypothetical protein